VVVCPASLIDTWLQEIQRALTGISGWRFHGTDRDAAFAGWGETGGILVTSFRQAEHLVARNHPSIGFAVIDEAHLVKNPAAQRTKIVRSLIGQANRVLLMGGTLLENRTAELIAVAELADPAQGVLALCQTIAGEDALILHGDVPLEKRPEVEMKFRESKGFATLVIQIDTGGIGLNLQAASVVILMEPQLKPSTEQQAIARAHRMGQTRPVVVYRLVAANSLDERIVQLSGFKAELFDQLARRSALAEAAGKLSAGVQDVNESELLDWAREQYVL
jgi:SNF2 family DNA or RNA helicase